MTEDEVVAELRDGMTIGIGGWGSRRKPMALVRAHRCARRCSDLTVVTYGGPDVGLLCAAGKVRKRRLRLRVARLDPARAALPGRPPDRRDRGRRARRGHAPVRPAGRGLAAAVPADPRRPRLRRAAREPRAARRCARPTTTARSWSPMPALNLDAALVPPEPRRRARQRAVPRPRPLLRRPVLHGRRQQRFMSRERIVPTEELPAAAASTRCAINRLMVDGVVEAPNGAHFTDCAPD